MRILTANLFHRVVGGAERYYLTVQRLLRRYGHEVAALSTRDGRNEPCATSEYFVEDVPPPSRVPWWRRLIGLPRYVSSGEARRNAARLLRKFRPDIVHLHTITYQLTPSILDPIREAGIPVIQTLHGYKPVCPVTSMLSDGRLCEGCGPGRFHEVLRRRCNEGSLTVSLVNYVESTLNRQATHKIDRFLAPSRFCADMMVRFRAIPAARIDVLPYCFDDRYDAAEGEGEFVLYFGRLSHEKGLPTLLAAAAMTPEIPVKIAGEGPLAESLRASATPNVEFLGYAEGTTLRSWIARSRVTVLPSIWHENYPLSIVESFASGRPVIGSRVGGIPELVVPGRTGWLVPPGDASALAQALREAWRDPAGTRGLGRSAREWALEALDPDRHVEALLEAYRKA